VLDTADRGAFDRRPVNGVIKLLIDDAHEADVVAADYVEPKGHLHRRLGVLGLADDALNGVLEDLGTWRQKSRHQPAQCPSQAC
jgi:hypothetical protein